MPVSALDFWGTVVTAMTFLVVLPFVVIRSLSRGLGPKRNRFDIIAALLAYPALFGLWMQVQKAFDTTLGSTMGSFLLGLAASSLPVVLALYVARRVVGSAHDKAVL